MYPPPRFLLRTRWSERLVSSLWRRWARGVLNRYSIQRRFDRLMLCDMQEPVGRAMITKGLWEFRQFEFLERELRARKGDRKTVFLDIGAYWGLYSLYFERLGLFDALHAFEPSPRNQVLLDAHLQMNGLEDAIEVHRVAISDKPGSLAITEFGGGSRVREGDGAIPALPLDDVLELADCLLVIKIDVEGHEARVLDGMRSTLARNKVLMQIESFPENKDAVFAKLEDMGMSEIGFVPPDDYVFAN
ncbi:MAG: FkbM family methyltransferase [Paracoccaceae bacterium]